MPSGLGVDIHPYYQRGTNALPGVEYGWVKMADGAAAYSKKADGKLWTADAHVALFHRLGIPVGGYEFASVSTAAQGAQAFDALWSECVRLGATSVAPAVDIEGEGWNKTNATQRGRAFCQRARARGIRPAVYMDLSLLQACRPDLWPENPVIWAPRYGGKPEVLKNGVQYTGRYDVHQYSSTGSLPGSAGAVDFNQSYSAPGKTPGAAHLITNTNPEDDMQLTDTLPWWNGDDGKPRTATVAQSLASAVGHAEYIEKLLAGQSASLASLTKMVVEDEANDVTAESLAAALVPAVLPQLSQALHDAVAGFNEIELSPEQIKALAVATVQGLGAALVKNGQPE